MDKDYWNRRNAAPVENRQALPYQYADLMGEKTGDDMYEKTDGDNYMYGDNLNAAVNQQSADWNIKPIDDYAKQERRERISNAVLNFSSQGDTIEDVIAASRILEEYIDNG